MNCQQAHNLCKAMCCRLISFIVPSLTEDQINYFNLHEGIRVIKRENYFVIVVKTKCKNLQENLLCAVYGKPERPQICDEGYTQVKSNVLFTPNCIYPPNKKSIVLNEEELP